MNTFTFVDLFAGIGGFHQAFKQLGGQCYAAYEIDKYACATYSANHHTLYSFNDVRTSWKEAFAGMPHYPIDIVSAGFPCQSFSAIGKRQGFADPRGQLVWAMMARIEEWQPRAILLENVKGLVSHDKGKTLEVILEHLKGLGYTCEYKVLRACDYGLPTYRPRVYIVGFKNGGTFEWPEPVPLRYTLSEVLGFDTTVPAQPPLTFSDVRDGKHTLHSWDIIPCTDEEKKLCNLILKNRRKKKYGDKDGNPLSTLDIIELWGSIDVEAHLMSLTQKNILKRTFEHKWDFVNSKSSSGVNGVYRAYDVHSEIYPTITASSSRDVVVKYPSYNPRKLTVSEIAKIMGFPDDFVFPVCKTQALKQLGNSVAVDVVYHITKHILKTLGKHD